MYCSKCGEKNVDGVKFCAKCGNSMDVGNKETNKSYGNIYETVGVSNKASNSDINYSALIGCGVFLISLFLPYVSVLGYSKNLMESEDGIFFLIVSIAGIVSILMKKAKISLAISIIAVVLTFIEISHTLGVLDSDYYGAWVEKGAGFWLVIAGALVYVVSTVKEVMKN